ncbi:MAG: PKD domain-containing protein [Candidatus Aenigmarchaeota archaeon]|nr:PKD domain-containing protein [Candidatus Aenigmarchaeota archaeon]
MILKLVAGVMAYLIVMLPVSFATNVNIISGGAVKATTSISPSMVVNEKISIVHEASDITWSKVKVLVTVNSASLAHSIERILVFKCKLLDPASCATNVAPIDFETFANTELLWSDISQKEGPSTYPQTAQLMTLVKVRDNDGQESWVGMWHTVDRANYNIFTQSNFELDSIDFHVKTIDLVDPTKNFIDNFAMIPFNWAEKVVFTSASSLFAAGGDTGEIDIPQLTSASPAGNQITSINKDFFLVFPVSTSGQTSAITLNQNPSFTAGDGICEANLGESPTNSCVDCGCATGQYCDIQNPPVCKATSGISVSVLPPALPTVTDCSKPIPITLNVQVQNPPATLTSTLTGILSLEGTPQAVACSGDGIFYTCPLQVQPAVSCGATSFSIGPNTLNLSLAFEDGLNTAILPVSATFSDIPVNLACGCPSGFFCEAGESVCSALGSVTVSVLNVTSFFSNFNPAGDTVTLTAKINNPAADLAVTGVQYTLGTLFKDSSPVLNATSGSVTCAGSPLDHVYTCSIPFSISNYNTASAYFFKGNSITFSTAFSDAGSTITKDLTSGFADITIPSFTCGDGVCNTEETQATCCTDCGCPQAGMYCDVGALSCGTLDQIDLAVLTVDPVAVTDCTPSQPHTISLTTQVANPPTDLKIDFVSYLKNNQVQAFPISCAPINPGANTGLFSCALVLPSGIEGCQDQPSGFVLGPNKLNMTVSFADGKQGIVTKTLSAGFSDITITPTFTQGDGLCETPLNETGANSCVDCGCDEFGSSFFCNVQLDSSSCQDKDDIQLVIDSPTAPVHFDSCEVSQNVEIKARIVNQPTNVENMVFSATLNGTNAEQFFCVQSGQVFGENLTAPFECSLGIAASQTCSKGNIATYANNDITVTLAFQSGLAATEIHSVTAPLPDIVITQQIVSIFDITQEAIAKMQAELDKTKQIVDAMLSQLENCLDVALFLAMMAVVAIIAGGIIGASEGGSTWAEGVQAGASAGTSLLTAWSTYCEMLNLYYNAQITAQEIRLKFVQSEFCMDLVQHQMDSGQCKNQELSCFDQMTSCLNFADIHDAMDNLGNFLSQITSKSQEFGSAVEDFGEGLGEFGDLFEDGSSTGASLSIQQNNIPGIDPYCNFRATKNKVTTSFGTKCANAGPNDVDTITATVFNKENWCQFPVVQIKTGTGELAANCDDGEDTCSTLIEGVQESLGQTWTAALYCFKDSGSYSASKLSSKTPTIIPFTVYADTDNDCSCEIGGEGDGSAVSPPDGGADEGSVSLKADDKDQITIASGTTVTLVAKVENFNVPGFVSVLKYLFDFGDGTPVDVESQSVNTLMSSVSHQYTVTGTHTATVNVLTPDDQVIGQDDVIITVTGSGTPPAGGGTGGGSSPPGNQAPVITILKPTSGEAVSGIYAIEGSIVDPDGDPVTAQIIILGSDDNYGDLTEGDFSIPWDTTLLPDGSVTIGITADDSHNPAVTQFVVVTVNN